MKPILVVLLPLSVAACDARSNPSPAQPAAQVLAPVAPSAAPAAVPAAGGGHRASQLELVRDKNQVCMVNDQFMGRDQIPVVIAERTYYGCCPMCKGKLERDSTARVAKDPVTGNSVDKAAAVIGRAPSGQVYYFESEASLRQYRL